MMPSHRPVGCLFANSGCSRACLLVATRTKRLRETKEKNLQLSDDKASMPFCVTVGTCNLTIPESRPPLSKSDGWLCPSGRSTSILVRQVYANSLTIALGA